MQPPKVAESPPPSKLYDLKDLYNLPTKQNTMAVKNEESKREVIEQFSKETTMHGIKYFFAPGILRKLVWLILFIVSTVFVCIQVTAQIQHYVSSPISTSIGVDFPDSLSFPAIMICNSNQYRIQKAYQKKLYDTIEAAYAKPVPLTINDAGVLTEISSNYSNDLTKLILDLGHRAEDMIINCTNVDQTECTVNSFSLKMTEYGPCYVFNINQTLSVRQAGPAYALTLYINLAEYEAMAGPVELSSLKVSVFSHDTEPVVSMNAIDIPAGFMSVIGLNYHTESKIVSCINEENMIHFPAKDYDVYKCKLDKLFNAIEQKCNCTPYYAPAITVKTQCVDKCNTNGYATSLSLAKISSKTMERLIEFNNPINNFADAMEAFTRKDIDQIKTVDYIFNRINKSTSAAQAMGMIPGSLTTTQEKLISSSNTYKQWYNTYKGMFDAVEQSSKHQDQKQKTTINTTNLMFGLKETMNIIQLQQFMANFEININNVLKIFETWTFWKNLLSSLYLNTGALDIKYLKAMNDLTTSYFNKQITRKYWADMFREKYQSFPIEYSQLVCSPLVTAQEFLNVLNALEYDNVTQLTFNYLNDNTEEADDFWLSMTYASTAVFEINLEGCDTVSQETKSTIYSSKFSNSSTSGQSGGQKPLAGGKRKRQAPVGDGGSQQGQQPAQEPTTCLIPSTNEYYRSFFEQLRAIKEKLKQDTREFIINYTAVCDEVINSYTALSDNLKDYSNNFNWHDGFYERNIVGLKIYFSDLSIKTLEQSVAYTVFSLICDIGGSLGLFLGASLLTFFEFIDMIIYGLIKKTNKVTN